MAQLPRVATVLTIIAAITLSACAPTIQDEAEAACQELSDVLNRSDRSKQRDALLEQINSDWYIASVTSERVWAEFDLLGRDLAAVDAPASLRGDQRALVESVLEVARTGRQLTEAESNRSLKSQTDWSSFEVGADPATAKKLPPWEVTALAEAIDKMLDAGFELSAKCSSLADD
jgi:hypothetical protein